MVLTKEQSSRYLRHIIIPEIRDQGQKKLLEASVSIYGENVKELFSLVLYLTAMGIGQVNCYFQKDDGVALLISQAKDLNTDVRIELIRDKSPKSNFRIVLGSPPFIKRISKHLLKDNFVPTLFSLVKQWKFALNLLRDSEDMLEFIELLPEEEGEWDISFPFLLSGALCSIEAVKEILNIGNKLEKILSFDLLNLDIKDYHKSESIKAIKSINSEYEKPTDISQGKILVVGAGGLGSPVSIALTMIGVGTIGLLDFDVVELSNLNRQVLHSTSRIGMLKAESAKYILKKLNPQIKINTHNVNLTKENAIEIIKEYDLVIAAVDNIETRYLLNDACYFLKKPLIESGILRFHGTSTTIIPEKGHCYRCLYPNIDGMSLKAPGILGAVPGVMGLIEALEAYKVITGTGTTLKNKLLLFDGLDMEFDIIKIEKNPECPICGENPTITKLQD